MEGSRIGTLDRHCGTDLPHRTVIALSGVVGAGKSTAARQIVAGLRAAGFEARHLRFQDFIRLSTSRQRARGAEVEVHQAGSAPGAVRWRAYRRRRLSMRVAAGYLLRTLMFRVKIRLLPRRTILVFDRYFYDSLVHFDLDAADRATRLLLRAIPSPSRAVVLIISPDIIKQRRPDYSPEYARQVAEGYEALVGRLPGVVIVQTGSVDAVDDLASRIVSGITGAVGAHGA
jgi:thymidylate kinase